MRRLYLLLGIGLLALALYMHLQRSAPSAPAVVSRQQTGPMADGNGIRVPIPEGWSFEKELAADGGPVALTNFGGKYASGGIAPAGGAEIHAWKVAMPTDLDQFIRTELKGAKIGESQPYTDGGKSGTAVIYRDEVSPGLIQKSVVIYVPQGAALYKFYLSFWESDSNESALVETLRQVIREARLS